jgi:predicted enzyme related to lactoylglutathione lyase
MTTEGVKTILYPVRDLAKARTLYSQLVGTEPTAESPYYVGFDVEGQHIGLLPSGHSSGMTAPVAYFHVSDIEGSMQALLDAGAETGEAARNVGGGRLVASVKDPDGNVIGLIQDPQA